MMMANMQCPTPEVFSSSDSMSENLYPTTDSQLTRPDFFILFFKLETTNQYILYVPVGSNAQTNLLAPISIHRYSL